MNLTIIGTGFVGVVTAAVYASFGNTVIGLDVNEEKVEQLRKGIVPFYEPNLSELLLEGQRKGNLSFTTNYQEAIQDADVIMIAVGTPSAPDGQADLTYVMMAADAAAPYLKEEAIVVVKSTVPPGTLEKVAQVISKKAKAKFHMASVPEFLKEGSAVDDTLHPDRVVLGASEKSVFARLEELHAPLDAPIVKVSPSSAQMAKYAANAYLATRITFINQIADLCEHNGADVQDVIEAISYDKRIGRHYWYPGFGYGGSCFPKDVKELAAYSRAIGQGDNLLNRMNEINESRISKLMEHFSEKIGGWSGKKVAVLGLSFKPNTDDMREAPSLKVIPYLSEQGAHVKGYDPKALPVVPHFLKEMKNVEYVESLVQAVEGADVIMALIEWKEITSHNFAHHRNKKDKQWFIDARNQFDRQTLEKAGFIYLGVGRS